MFFCLVVFYFRKFFSCLLWFGWCNLCKVLVLIWWICLWVILNIWLIFFKVCVWLLFRLKCKWSIFFLWLVNVLSIFFNCFFSNLYVVWLDGEVVFWFLIKLFRCELFFLLIGVLREIGFCVILRIFWIFLVGKFIFLLIFFGEGLWFKFCNKECCIWISLLIVLIICIGIWIVFVWFVIVWVIVWWIYYVV